MDIFAPHATDFYKTGHVRMYPDGSNLVYSNLTCRSARHAQVLPDFDGRTVFFGLQAVLQDLVALWDRSFFQRPRAEVLARYRRRMDASLGAGAVSTDHIAALHDLGYLPLLVKAVPEGALVPLRVPSLTIRNTRPEFAWLTNYVETQLSAGLWKPITSATTAREFRRLFDRYAAQTGSDPAMVDWQGHDFSMRGMSSLEDAALSGAAHLLSFKGTDTILGIDLLEQYYAGPDGVADDIVGGSVPATEHSVMCMGGREDEIGTFRRLITETYPSGIISVVSDTWDFWRVVTEYVPALKEAILARVPDALGRAKVVLRPDSGDPVLIVAGDPAAPEGSPQRRGAIGCLWDIFGGTITATGHKLLHPAIGLIYGDSIDLDKGTRMLESLAAQGFASGNVVLGLGSFTYQHVTRDSYGIAVKATYGEVHGEPRPLSKDPATDDGTKRSARGLLRVDREEGRFTLHTDQSWAEEEGGALEPVLIDGKMVRHQTLRDVRALLAAG